MNRHEASERADELNRAHPERDAFVWLAQARTDTGWEVFKIPRAMHNTRQRWTETAPDAREPVGRDVPGMLPGGVSPWSAGGA